MRAMEIPDVHRRDGQGANQASRNVYFDGYETQEKRLQKYATLWSGIQATVSDSIQHESSYPNFTLAYALEHCMAGPFEYMVSGDGKTDCVRVGGSGLPMRCVTVLCDGYSFNS